MSEDVVPQVVERLVDAYEGVRAKLDALPSRQFAEEMRRLARTEAAMMGVYMPTVGSPFRLPDDLIKRFPSNAIAVRWFGLMVTKAEQATRVHLWRGRVGAR